MDVKQLRNGNVLAGVLLIVLGLIFFAVTQGAFSLNWGNFWPLIPLAIGALIVVQAFATDDLAKRGGLVLGGTIPLLLGAFFFATTTGILSWEDQGRLWPVYPLIVGVGFLAAYLASDRKQFGYLIPAGVLVLIGLIFLTITLLDASYSYLGKLWPLALILVGVLLLSQRMLGRKAQ